MVHSALKRKRYSDDSTQSALCSNSSSSATVVANIPTGYSTPTLHRTPTRKSSSMHNIAPTSPPQTPGSPFLDPSLVPSHDPRASVRMLLELMTPSEFSKLLRARVDRVLAKWPPPVVSPSHGLPSPTSSSSSASYRPRDSPEAQDPTPRAIHAFVSFFRSEDMPSPPGLSLQELHTHLIALQTLLSFLTSRELRDIVRTRLNGSGDERHRWATIQGVMDVLRNTGADCDGRDGDSDDDATTEASVAQCTGVGHGSIPDNSPRSQEVVAGDNKHVEVGINPLTERPLPSLREPSVSDNTPVWRIPSPPRPQEHVKVERPRKRARTVCPISLNSVDYVLFDASALPRADRDHPAVSKNFEAIAIPYRTITPAGPNGLPDTITSHSPRCLTDSTAGPSRDMSSHSAVSPEREHEDLQHSASLEVDSCGFHPTRGGARDTDGAAESVVPHADVRTEDAALGEQGMESEGTYSTGVALRSQPEVYSLRSAGTHVNGTSLRAAVDCKSLPVPGHNSLPYCTTRSRAAVLPMHKKHSRQCNDTETDVDMDMSDEGEIVNGVSRDVNNTRSEGLERVVRDTAHTKPAMMESATYIPPQMSLAWDGIEGGWKTGDVDGPASPCEAAEYDQDTPATQTPWVCEDRYHANMTALLSNSTVSPPSAPFTTPSPTVFLEASSTTRSPVPKRHQAPNSLSARLAQSLSIPTPLR
ncbi:hypothetical protein JB92DRAFT_50512 [Gautieria morchelliformis]|nr:hypothetical protein JB92DRAFT_50512 [Gautieria morchelliformis]